MTAARDVVIGVGHEGRGDDVVGLLVARRLAARDVAADDASGGLRVVEHDGDGMDLVLVWEGAERAIVVDAVVSEALPKGGLHRFEAHREALPTRIFAGHSTHALGVADAIELARAIDRLPQSLVVYGIECARFDTGGEPDPAVLAAVEPVVDRILAELDPPSGGESGRA